MAKDKQLSQLVFFGDILWNPARNYRKEMRGDPNTAVLTESMVLGWRSNVDPVIGMDKGCLDFDDAEIACAMEKRQKDWDSLKTSTDQMAKWMLAAFELLYCKNHKLVIPKYAASSCFGRAGVYPAALAKFLHLKETQMRMNESELKNLEWNPKTPNVRDRDSVVAVPVVIHDFATEDDRLEEQIKENTLKNVGNLPTSDIDNLRAAYKLFTSDKIRPESYFRATFNASLGVKYYALCYLNNRFPTLRLMERLLSEPTAPGYISLSSVDFREVQKFKVASIAQDGYGRKTKNPLPPVSIVELETYFNNPDAAEGQSKTLGRKAWDAVIQSESVDVVKEIARGALKNDTDFITKVMRPNKDSFNMVLELVHAGKGDLVKDVLMKVKEGVNFLEVFQERNALKTGYDEVNTRLKMAEEALTAEKELADSVKDTLAKELEEANTKIKELESKIQNGHGKKQKTV